MPPRPNINQFDPFNDPRYIFRVWAAPLSFLSTNSPSNVLAASGGTQAATFANPDTVADAIITHVAFKSDGPFLMQVTPSDLGAGLFLAPVSSDTMLALLDRPGMLPRPIFLSGAQTLRIDLTNDFGAVANNVRLTFWGYRRFPRGGAGQRC